MGGRTDVSGADLKTRLFVSQGNRLINYYLIAGGRNIELETIPKDGNQRIASTGERHGFAAPINPEGELSYTYPRMAESIHTMRTLDEQLAVMKEEFDGVAFGFIPDYFMTEYHYPKSKKAVEMIGNLMRFRSGATWDFFVKGMLLNHFRFPAIDIQNKALDPTEHPLIVIPTARYMDEQLQKKLLAYVKTGGKLFLHGELPIMDMNGEECQILIDELGLTYHSDMTDYQYFLSVKGTGKLAYRPEGRTPYVQLFDAKSEHVLVQEKHSELGCGFQIPYGSGKVMAFTTNLTGKEDLIKELFAMMDTVPVFETNHPHGGIFLTSTRNENGERLLHILNLDGFDKSFQVREQGELLFEGNELYLGAYRGVVLPLDLHVDDKKVLYSTAEIIGFKQDSLQLRLQNEEEVICFAGEVAVKNQAGHVHQESGMTKVVIKKTASAGEEFSLFFE